MHQELAARSEARAHVHHVAIRPVLLVELALELGSRLAFDRALSRLGIDVEDLGGVQAEDLRANVRSDLRVAVLLDERVRNCLLYTSDAADE